MGSKEFRVGLAHPRPPVAPPLHTQLSLEMTVNSTKVVSNQYGYEGNECGFRPNMQITLYDDKTVTVTDADPMHP